ncbi:hypothetical protein TPAR_05451 [Tolypocladium paradoxum]|uniref:Zn(2)-C6 fungal-type domain-containing protein n=1 Tax=Tolypocladium paradoxum TaxID=94208 RepID=A0A2S4KVY2_9HYPO|nr:hypothetical protein TPAR_05451 [Tolypocladium paradoxum]
METTSSLSGPSAFCRDERTASGGQTKRRRVHTACMVCQVRKTGCDGRRPACSTCSRRGVAADCAYDSAAIPPAHCAQSSLAAFEERLGRLEQTQLPKTVGSAPSEYHEKAHGCIDNGICNSSSSGDSRSFTAAAWSSVGVPTPGTMQDLDDIDGLATVSSIDDGECLYGASSTIALARFCRGEAPRHESSEDTASPKSLPRPSERRSRVSIAEEIRERDVGATLYPPRQTADDFVRCFWDFVHPLFPVLHKTSFMQRYQLLWSGHVDTSSQHDPSAHMEQTIFSSTLNVIFSLGCQFSRLVPAQNKTAMAQDFYQRSRRIYNHEVLDSMSIPLVQMLLLTGVYLQSAQNANRCWNVIGLAIRVAQGLGLHVERPKPPGQCQVDREMRRRIWHCCLVLDR